MSLVSYDDYVSWLIEIATGWLRWPPAQAWREDCCSILLGYQGQIEKLKAVYGSSEETPAPAATPSKRKLTPELFGALFG